MPSRGSSDGSRARAERDGTLLDRLLAFESEPELLTQRFDYEQMLIWPFARWRVLNAALQGARSGPAVDSSTPKIALRTQLEYLRASVRRDPLWVRRRFDLVMFGSTVGVTLQREGKWFGRVNDYFALEQPERTLVVDASYLRRFREPRYVPHVAFHDAIWARAALRARLASGPSTAERAAVDRFTQRLQDQLPVRPTPAGLSALSQHLLSLASRLPYLRGEYLRLFERLRPKLILLEDASYGTQAYILRWAHELGIRTAEPQHGMIPATHPAYNLGAQLRDSAEYRRYLPEFLLTYGRFWHDNTRTASSLVAIGNPHFSAMRSAQAPLGARKDGKNGRRYALISMPESAVELVALARELSALLRAQDALIYRLHPLENASAALYAPLRALPNVTISASGDIYAVLSEVDAVIGTTSTVLYEAAGLGLSVYVYATADAEASTPRKLGRWFSKASELPALTAGDSSVPTGDEFFASDWQRRFAEFLHSVGAG